jgi:hypothetical protein
MQIKRPSNRRKGLLLGVGCGCLGITAAAIAFIAAGLILLPGLALRFAGFAPKGSTADVFANVSPAATVEVLNPITPAQAVVDFGTYGQQPIKTDASLYSVAVGQDNSGGQLATVTFTEPGLMDLCRQRADMCANTNAQFRNPSLDLRPGGAMIYAEVNIPQLNAWQRIGVALRLDTSRKQFELVGVDVGGALYGLPSGELGDKASELARAGNDMLRQLTLEASGGRYTLSEVRIDDDTLTLILR